MERRLKIMRLWWMVPLCSLACLAQPKDAREELTLGVAAYNNAQYEEAIAHLSEAVRQEPDNDVAIAYLGSIYFNQKKFDEAADWYQKVIALKPDDKEPCYTMGVIVWSQWYPAYSKARVNLGMKPEDPGPIIDETVRQELKSAWADKLERGIQYLEKALGI